MTITDAHLKNICRSVELAECAFPVKLRRILSRNPATSATIGQGGLPNYAISRRSRSRPMSFLSGIARTLRTNARTAKLGQLIASVSVLIAISGNAHAASYAESLFKEKFEVHIRQMAAEGISRKDANYIAYAALARGSYEICGDHLFPKSMASGSYEQLLEETSLSSSVIDRHIRAFERIMQAYFPDERAAMRYCSSKP